MTTFINYLKYVWGHSDSVGPSQKNAYIRGPQLGPHKDLHQKSSLPATKEACQNTHTLFLYMGSQMARALCKSRSRPGPDCTTRLRGVVNHGARSQKLELAVDWCRQSHSIVMHSSRRAANGATSCTNPYCLAVGGKS